MYIFRLLDVLADRKDKKRLSGHVLINGKRQPHNFKCASAYVIQVCEIFQLKIHHLQGELMHRMTFW